MVNYTIVKVYDVPVLHMQLAAQNVVSSPSETPSFVRARNRTSTAYLNSQWSYHRFVRHVGQFVS